MDTQQTSQTSRMHATTHNTVVVCIVSYIVLELRAQYTTCSMENIHLLAYSYSCILRAHSQYAYQLVVNLFLINHVLYLEYRSNLNQEWHLVPQYPFLVQDSCKQLAHIFVPPIALIFQLGSAQPVNTKGNDCSADHNVGDVATSGLESLLRDFSPAVPLLDVFVFGQPLRTHAHFPAVVQRIGCNMGRYGVSQFWMDPYRLYRRRMDKLRSYVHTLSGQCALKEFSERRTDSRQPTAWLAAYAGATRPCRKQLTSKSFVQTLPLHAGGGGRSPAAGREDAQREHDALCFVASRKYSAAAPWNSCAY